MTGMSPTPNVVRVSQTIRATPERLFHAWTDPAQLARWWRMNGPGWTFAGAALDLRVGGQYRLAMTGPDGKTHTAFGVYREIDPPKRLAFTWEWEDPERRIGNTVVTVDIHGLSTDTSEIILTHEGFADIAQAPGHESGWRQLLTLLDQTTAIEDAL
ncbi:MAG: SRPBCC domain-containing protein [Gemmatimonadales bacterium]